MKETDQRVSHPPLHCTTRWCRSSTGIFQHGIFRQSVIGSDPGRRDMFVGVVHGGGKAVKCTTRCCYYRTGRRAAAQLAEKRFSTVTTSGTWLPTEKRNLPASRVVQLAEWNAYLGKLFAILPQVMSIWQERVFRRQDFRSSMRRDAFLDQQRSRITGRQRGCSVAFVERRPAAQASVTLPLHRSDYAIV